MTPVLQFDALGKRFPGVQALADVSFEIHADECHALLDRTRRRGVRLHNKRERELTRDYFERLRVRAPHVDADIAGLSGGNQQKIALAKWPARECRVLILDEPTRGVDVGAKADMHELIDHLASRGRAILLISSDLPELFNLSTRVLVMATGGSSAGSPAKTRRRSAPSA